MTEFSRVKQFTVAGFQPFWFNKVVWPDLAIRYPLFLCWILLGWPSPTLAQIHDEKPIELSGFSLSQAYEIPDGQPLDLNDPVLKQLLYRISRTSPASRNEYSKYSANLTWKDVTEKTEDHRLWLFDIPARLTHIKKHKLQNHSPDEEIKSVYVCFCQTVVGTHSQSGEEGRPAAREENLIALTRAVPRSLQLDQPLDEPIRVSGFLYSRISGLTDDDNDEVPVFIADRLSWFPEKESETTSPELVQLAQHGFDVGLIDVVEENNTKSLGKQDAEAFFQFLSAVNRMAASKPDAGQPQLGFTDLMRDADSNFGRSIRLKGVVRTCSVIPIPHDDIQQRLGISQYYQLMMFPDLDGVKIVVKSKTGEQLDYRRFPVTVCCTELPDGISPAEMERKSFTVDGFFYRFWKYQSDKTDEAGMTGQVSPLIVAKAPTLIDTGAGDLNRLLLIFVCVVIGGICLMIVGYRFADSQRKSAGTDILDSLPEKIDIESMREL